MKGEQMFAFQRNTKISRVLGLLAFICALVLGSQPAALAGAQVPFRASYSLDLDADFSSLPLVGITGEGSGLASHLGGLTARSISETVNLATGEGLALYEFTAANGDVVLFSFHFLAIPTSQTQFSVGGVWEITGGSGRFEGATGAGSYQGRVQFTSATTAAGAFELAGRISSVGSIK